MTIRTKLESALVALCKSRLPALARVAGARLDYAILGGHDGQEPETGAFVSIYCGKPRPHEDLGSNPREYKAPVVLMIKHPVDEVTIPQAAILFDTAKNLLVDPVQTSALNYPGEPDNRAVKGLHIIAVHLEDEDEELDDEDRRNQLVALYDVIVADFDQVP